MFSEAGESPYRRHKKILLGVIALLTCNVLMAQGSLVEYGRLIGEATGKPVFPYYTAYGCYCRFGGKGQARDATDRCCFAHDCCYAALKNKCRPRVDIYQYTYNDGNITCVKGTMCQMQVCECDRVAALCLRNNLDSYNKALLFYKKGDKCNEGVMQC